MFKKINKKVNFLEKKWNEYPKKINKPIRRKNRNQKPKQKS